MAKPQRLTESRWLRYQRQLYLPEWSEAAQVRLSHLRVLIVGVGGLGCPISVYLAAAGVEHITLVDPDTVSLSNLHRQILFTPVDVGKPKVEVTQNRLREMNADLNLRSIQEPFSADNAETLLSDHDLVIDGADNLSVTYLINDACQYFKLPWIYGSVYRFEGQVASFEPGPGCFRCLYPEPPPAEAIPTCNEAGILGMVVGTAANLQALEVMRLIGQWEQGLEQEMLLLNLKTMDFHKMKLPTDPQCLGCGPDAVPLEQRLKSLTAAEPSHGSGRSDWDIAAAEAHLRHYPERVLDVRSFEERRGGSLTGLHVPLQELKELQPQKLEDMLNPEVPLLVYCQKGMRSRQAVDYLLSRGFKQVYSLAGGYETLLQSRI